MVPISLATNLKYGVENDFYFEGHPSLPPANIFISKNSNTASLMIKRGANANNIVNENITIKIEEPSGAGAQNKCKQ